MFRKSDFLLDDVRAVAQSAGMTHEEQGVLALLEGVEAYTRLCAPKYADPCAAIEMGIPQMFEAARAMLSYAPDTLRRGAIDHEYAMLLKQWHIDPDTYEWIGGNDDVS